MLLGGGDGGQIDLHDYVCFSITYYFSTPAAAERHRVHRGRATAPCPPHTAAQGVIGERSDANSQLRERGGGKEPSRGRCCSAPVMGDHNKMETQARTP